MDNMRNCGACSNENEMQRMMPRDNCSSQECERWSIAMAYVPWQNLEKVYEPAQALRSGTLFPELEKPFMAYASPRRGARK